MKEIIIKNIKNIQTINCQLINELIRMIKKISWNIQKVLIMF
jgi:hypothetical protein